MRWLSLLLVLVMFVPSCMTQEVTGPRKVVITCSNEICDTFDELKLERPFKPEDIRYVVTSLGPDMLRVELTIRHTSAYSRMFVIKGPLTSEFILECVVRITKDFIDSTRHL